MESARGGEGREREWKREEGKNKSRKLGTNVRQGSQLDHKRTVDDRVSVSYFNAN